MDIDETITLASATSRIQIRTFLLTDLIHAWETVSKTKPSSSIQQQFIDMMTSKTVSLVGILSPASSKFLDVKLGKKFKKLEGLSMGGNMKN